MINRWLISLHFLCTAPFCRATCGGGGLVAKVRGLLNCFWNSGTAIGSSTTSFCSTKFNVRQWKTKRPDCAAGGTVGLSNGESARSNQGQLHESPAARLARVHGPPRLDRRRRLALCEFRRGTGTSHPVCNRSTGPKSQRHPLTNRKISRRALAPVFVPTGKN